MKGAKSKAGAKESKLSVKKGASKPVKKGKADINPNKPKRPFSALFVFMKDFRQQYKKSHPNNKYVAGCIEYVASRPAKQSSNGGTMSYDGKNGDEEDMYLKLLRENPKDAEALKEVLYENEEWEASRSCVVRGEVD